MRINDFHNILELVKQDILHSEAEYLKLLKVIDLFVTFCQLWLQFRVFVDTSIQRRFS